MRYSLAVAGVLTVILGSATAQDNSWKPLGGWQLIERLDDVQIVKVLRKSDLMPAIFPPKPTWQPDAGDFFPASDVLLYRRMYAFTGQQQYYAYESYNIVLDDANIRRLFDPSGVGRFRIGRVEIAVYFPYAGIYTIQGFWTGNKLDEAIARHVRQRYNLMIGERTAEEIKIRIGSAYPLQQELTMEVRGRELVEGLPRTVVVHSEEIRNALTEPVNQIVEKVRSVLEETPPELASDIIERGIVLTGGGALLRGFDKLLQQATGIPVYIADDPLSCVAIGTGRALEEMDAISKAAQV